MSKITLVTGGARSGKSALAESLTKRSGDHFFYIATAEALDVEMRNRIEVHQARRGAEWTTVPAPIDLINALDATDKAPRLVDCLTIWLSNILLSGRDWRGASKDLTSALMQQRNPIVFVTNEVGSGIVPENALAREFRDAAGWLNQEIAALADEVFLSVSGCPVRIKPNDAVL